MKVMVQSNAQRFLKPTTRTKDKKENTGAGSVIFSDSEAHFHFNY
jgi:hypothetical protein